MSRFCVAALSLGLVMMTAAASPVSPSLDDRDILRDSLQQVPAKRRGDWLESRGFDASYWTRFRAPESTGLRLVGKYGRGPSNEVTGQDTLVALTLGSEVALLSFADPDNPRVLSEIQLDCIVRQSHLRDSLLFTGGNGIRVWNVTDASQPVERGLIPYGVGDFSVQDSLVCFVSLDTFFVYSAADPANPRRLGFLPDSGHVAAATSRVAVLIQPNDVLGFIDLADPANPRHVGSWPGWARSADARGNLLCVTFTDPANQDRAWLLTIDISNPASPRQLGRVDSVCGYDLHIEGDYAFASGRYESYEGFKTVDISDSASPRVLGRFDYLGQKWGVWADIASNRALIADDGFGLLVLDIANLSTPLLDTVLLRADLAVDVWVDGNRAYVADYRGGMRILDVSDPTQPVEMGGRDSVGATFVCLTSVARDSFAYMSWGPGLQNQFRTVLVGDPSQPRVVAGLTVPSRPEDMVLRDTLVYAVGNQRFYVVNVARPREPRLVGSCVSTDGNYFGLAVQDTFAYEASFYGLWVINVARPDAPFVVCSGVGRNAAGIAVRDTLVYLPAAYDTLWVYSVANPSSPRVVGIAPLLTHSADVALGESVAVVATSQGLELFSLRNPASPQRIGSTSTPYGPRRIVYSWPYFYAAMWDAGVAIYATETVGIRDAASAGATRPDFLVRPNPSSGTMEIRSAPGVATHVAVRVLDVAGREVMTQKLHGTSASFVIAGLPGGVYVLELSAAGHSQRIKIVKR